MCKRGLFGHIWTLRFVLGHLDLGTRPLRCALSLGFNHEALRLVQKKIKSNGLLDSGFGL